MQREKGWKSIPLSLKILFAVFIFWTFGSILNAPNLYVSGVPLLGTFVYGIPAILVALFFDIVGPMTFLYALWNRKSWAVVWAFTYIGIFIFNSVIALFTVREQLGLVPMLIPTIASIVFLIVIYTKRSYFK